MEDFPKRPSDEEAASLVGKGVARGVVKGKEKDIGWWRLVNGLHEKGTQAWKRLGADRKVRCRWRSQEVRRSPKDKAERRKLIS